MSSVPIPSPPTPPSVDLIQVPLLDSRGCLTDGALCFVDEMLPEQRAVVARHLAICSACSHDQSEIQRATRLVRQARPYQGISTEARLVGQQVLLRGSLRSAEQRLAVPGTSRQRQRRLWLRYGLLAGALAFGISAALLFLLLR